MKRSNLGNSKVAVGYLRVSTDDQKLGPRAQCEAIEAWALAAGVTLTVVFFDHGVSGAAKLSARPGLVAALAALPLVGAGVLVAGKRDRLARSVTVMGAIECEAKRVGAVVRTSDGQSDAEGSAGLLTKGIHDVFAAFEREVISERTIAALAVKRARGERTGSVPYGMRVGLDGVRLEPCPTESAVVALARSLRAEGLTQRAIVAELTARGIPTRTGGAWRQTQICRMLAA